MSQDSIAQASQCQVGMGHDGMGQDSAAQVGKGEHCFDQPGIGTTAALV